MTYPTRQISFISYRQQSRVSSAAHANAIHCCSEHSEYDPAAAHAFSTDPRLSRFPLFSSSTIRRRTGFMLSARSAATSTTHSLQNIS
jgi:hypothetical protein